MTNQVIITEGQLTKVEVTPPNQPTVEFGLTTIGLRGPQGIQGPVGPACPNEIGGIPVFVSSPQNGDVISFNGAAFINRAQVELTDGGNF